MVTASGAGRPMVVLHEMWRMAEEVDEGSQKLLATGCFMSLRS